MNKFTHIQSLLADRKIKELNEANKPELDPNEMMLSDMSKLNSLIDDALKIGSDDIDASGMKNGTKLIASYAKARKLVSQVDAEIKRIEKLYN